MSQNARNFSHSSNFLFTTTLFGEESSYRLQTANLPGASFSHIQAGKSAVFGNFQGDTVTYPSLSVTFIIDEQLDTWRELISIVQKMREPESNEGELVEKWAFLEIHDDNSNVILKLSFRDIMLESIGDLEFNTTSEDEILTLDVSMVYDFYTVEPKITKE